MILRKLEPQERAETRKLWEEVFPEDTKEFLDYYYFVKTGINEIYVIEADGEIRSMIQLNPYKIQIMDRECASHYIIAVSTQKEYRGRGFMRSLLIKSMEEMYGNKEPFTFLMPASEKIYTPYDFRYIYQQHCGVIDEEYKTDAEENGKETVCSDAGVFEAGELAEYFHRHFSGIWNVYALRDETYYRTMILEQQSEHGGVRVLRCGGEIIGIFAYAREEELEIREPLILPGYEREFEKAVSELAASGEKVKVYGCLERDGIENYSRRPIIMARILYLPALMESMKTAADINMDCSFAVIDPILRKNSTSWHIWSCEGEEEVHMKEAEDSEGVFPIAELTEFLFGVKTADELKDSEGVILTERLVHELGKLRKLNRVFLNEVV